MPSVAWGFSVPRLVRLRLGMFPRARSSFGSLLPAAWPVMGSLGGWFVPGVQYERGPVRRCRLSSAGALGWFSSAESLAVPVGDPATETSDGSLPGRASTWRHRRWPFGVRRSTLETQAFRSLCRLRRGSLRPVLLGCCSISLVVPHSRPAYNTATNLGRPSRFWLDF